MVKCNWKGFILWSNQFYGICAVSLAMVSGLIFLGQVPNIWICLLIHLATVVFYSQAYLQESKYDVSNERVIWYQQNQKYLLIRQVLFTCICLYIAFIKLNVIPLFFNDACSIQLIFFATIFLCLAYYMPHIHVSFLEPYRAKGVLKSIAIAWVWTIICALFPIWLQSNANYHFWNLRFIIYFLQLFIYVLVLAILFDIKDMQQDQIQDVNTIVLKLGLNPTLKLVIAPLLICYYLTYVFSMYQFGASPISLFSQGVLVTLTYLIALKIMNQKAIHANILLIDGLLILKAMLGLLVLLIQN